MKLAAVVFLDVEDVEALHEIGLRYGGGLGCVRDRGALEAAVMRPRVTFGGAPLYPTLAEMAAALLEGVARNHPFVDGNKRAAFLAALTFLEVNGYPIRVGREWAGHVEAVATGALPLDALATLFAMVMGTPVPVD